VTLTWQRKQSYQFAYCRFHQLTNRFMNPSAKNLARLPRRVAGRVKRLAVAEMDKRLLSRRLRQSLETSTVRADKGVVLFFAPEAAVEPHLAQQCVLARSLQDLGHDVLMARCYDLYPHCPAMDMLRLPYEKTEQERRGACISCAQSSFRMLDDYGLPHIDLRRFMTPEKRERVRQALANPPRDLREFEFDGLPFGEACTIDLVLATKVSNFAEAQGNIRVAWLKYIENSLLSYLLIDDICASIPVHSIMHYNDYSLLLGAHLAARKHGATCFTVTHPTHLNLDRRRAVIYPLVGAARYRNISGAWKEWRELALPAPRVAEIGEDLLSRLGALGSTIFSTAKTYGSDARSALGLDPNKKLLVAYTSSLDELFATKMTAAAVEFPLQLPPQPFIDQIDWLHALTQFVECRDDLQLAVRVHPREGNSARSQGESEHLIRLKAEFDREFNHCRFVWPENPISSYDLAEVADVALISWSTIGVELARAGLPVLAAASGPYEFPGESCVEWTETKEAYFQKLDELLTDPVTLKTLSRAYRWYNLMYLGTSLDMSDVFPHSDFNGLPAYHPLAEARTVEAVMVQGRPLQEINHERLVAQQHAGGEAEESQALQDELRRVVHLLLTGQMPGHSLKLRTLQAGQLQPDELEAVLAEAAQEGVNTIIVDGGQVRYLSASVVTERYSPLCARLAPLCGNVAIS